jgi:8-oxo-dGTP pyrophosphatase MutT (NUDIX family)
MVASSILPISVHNGQLFFLFGKENEMEDSAKGFSDFGGRVEKNESILDTAFREGSEELCGFLGDDQDIKRLIQKSGVLKYSHNDYHVHIFPIDYDHNLPIYFTNHHRFVWNRMNKKMLNESKVYEKQEICWFSVQDLKTRRNDFRPFYREIIDQLLKHIVEIRKFSKKFNYNKSSVTRNSIARNFHKHKDSKPKPKTRKFFGFTLPFKGG